VALKQTKDTIVQTVEGNVILETTQAYVPDSVSVTHIISAYSTETYEVVEIGGNYLQLVTAPPVGATLEVIYNVRTSDSLDVDILQRLRAIEEQVEKQNKMLDILTKAVENRVDKHTFRVWLKAMEQSFGKPILEQNLLGIQAVHQSSNN
jgi:hypothetical protein